MAVLCLVQFVDVLGVTEMITAMPRILDALSAPASAATLLLTAYAMCFGGLLMLGARVGDRFGHRRTLLAGIAGFAAGSLACAVAGSDTALVAGRCLQGASAAMSVPSALRLLSASAPDPARRRGAMAAWSATGAAAGAAGYLVGGGLTELAGWRALFWLNLPLAGAMAAGVLARVERDEAGVAARLDLPGAALFTAAVMAVVLAGSQLQRSGAAVPALPTLAVGALLLAALVWTERRAREPLFGRELLRQRPLRTGVGAAFANTATTSSAIAIATLELQRDQGVGAAAAGLRLLPFSLCVIAGAAVAGRALRRISEPNVIAIGLSAIAFGDALPVAGPGLLIAGVSVAGAGIGISSVAATGLGTAVPARLQGAAAGIINTAAQLGTALGVAGLLLLVATAASAGLPLAGARLGWLVASAVALASAVLIAPWLRPGSAGPRARSALRGPAAWESSPARARDRTRGRPR